MALRPVSRRLVPDEVFDQILTEVVDGELSAGESLPSERRLAEVLGVSRPAVREALQRMAMARLVEVRHGGAIAVWAFPRLGLGLTFLVSVAGLGLVYEWTHYLVHSDYRPRSTAFRAVWRNHRLHHYKNEHYWFTVTSAGTADRLLGTYPEPSAVETSPTVRRLHEGAAG